MLRIVWLGNSLPLSWPVDPSAEFEPGQIGQLKLLGNNIVCGVSDGTAPIGIIDDIKKNAFTATSIDEVVIASASGVSSGGTLVTPIDLNVPLENPNVVESSFISHDVDVELTARNGMITFLAGTELNFSLAGTGTPDSIRTVVSYAYQQPNVPGDDSTIGSNRVTIWFDRVIAETDMFETNQKYKLNAPLFVTSDGKFTTREVVSGYPSVGFVTAPPTSVYGTLQFYWF